MLGQPISVAVWIFWISTFLFTGDFPMPCNELSEIADSSFDYNLGILAEFKSDQWETDSSELKPLPS